MLQGVVSSAEQGCTFGTKVFYHAIGLILCLLSKIWYLFMGFVFRHKIHFTCLTLLPRQESKETAAPVVITTGTVLTCAFPAPLQHAPACVPSGLTLIMVRVLYQVQISVLLSF